MNFLEARKNMVDGQLRPNRIRDPRVLAAFAKVPRERFMPPEFQEVAYADTPILLEGGRVILTPLVQARMLQGLAIQPEDHVLVIGGLDGYVPALLLELGAKITVVEPDKHHAITGQNCLQDMNYSCPAWQIKEPLSGLKAQGPYDHIILNMTVAEVPECLFLQLKEEGHLASIETQMKVTSVMLYTRRGKTCFAESLTETQSLPTPQAMQWEERFVF